MKKIKSLVLSGWLISVPVIAAENPPIDPWEKTNRTIFRFNDTLDRYTLKPVAKTYTKVIPSPVRTGVSNFLGNLTEPWTMVNAMLQGKPSHSAIALYRFVFNSITSLGFYDTAKHLNLYRTREDFGQTLAVWGVPAGPYVMLPFWGPSTARDAISKPLDALGYFPNHTLTTPHALSLEGVEFVDLRANILPLEDAMVSPDRYSLLRDVYLQNRKKDIFDGVMPETPGQSDDSFFGEDEPVDETSRNAAPLPEDTLAALKTDILVETDVTTAPLALQPLNDTLQVSLHADARLLTIE